MAYQDDFRNKVIAALKKKNLAVDLSEEQTQEAIVQEIQIVAQNEPTPISPEEMRTIIQDVARQVAAENKVFTAQSNNFIAFVDQQTIEGELEPGQGSYSGGGIASSVANKDIVIIPSNGGLGAAGTATSVNSISQIDFKHIANPNAYASFDPNEVKASLFNWAERIGGTLFDTPVLGIGGAWGGVSYAPTAQWGVGNSRGSGIGGSINQVSGFGQIIFFKPATSTIYSSLFNDVAISNDFASRYISIIGYQSALPGVFPTAGFAISFGGIGGSGPLAISGAANAGQSNQIKFLSPLTISNQTAGNTLTLGLSSATSTVQNFVGGGVAQYALSTTTSSFSQGDIFYASGSGHVQLTRLTVGGNGNYLTVSSGVPTWTASIGANAVNVNAAVGSTLMFPVFVNASGNQVGIALSSDVNFFVDPLSNTFYAGSAVSSSTFTGTGSLSIKPGANTTTAITLQKADGTNILVVDTTNNLVGINKTPVTYALDVSGDTNVSGVYRIGNTQILSSTTLSNVTASSLTSVGIINSGTWSATAITTNYGGTGYATYSVGDIIYASTTSFLSKLAVGTSGQILGSNGTIPGWVNPSTLTVNAAIAATTLSLQLASSGTVYPVLSPQNSAGPGVGLSVDGGLSFTPVDNALYATIFSGTALTGTLGTASQPNVTGLGTITTGIWNATAIGTTYGGTGSNLGGNNANAFKIPVLGSAANAFAATLIDGANSGYLLMANSNSSAPTFVNSTSATFTFGGTLNITTAAITNGTVTGTPTSANDIVNKSYADSISGGLDVHASARLTTIAAIGGSYRQAGTAGTLAGVGDYIISTTANTLIVSESNWDTVGIALTNGQRVLVKDGVTGGYASGSGVWGAYPTTYGGIAASWVANGIYSVASYGGAGTSGWLLVRATDTDNQAGVQELTGGTFLFVEEGSTYADHAFVCTNDTTSFGPIGFGSTQISWSLFAGGNTLIAGQGLVESGNNLALLFNLVQSNTVNSNLSRGFILGGTRAASLGSSSLVSFTVSGDSNTIASTATLTSSGDGWTLAGGRTSRTFTFTGSDSTFSGNADGFSLSGGSSTARTLTVISGPITVANGIFNGGGTGLTLSSPGYLSLNNNTLSISASTSNITFNPSSTTNTTHNLVSSGSAQYQLSSADTSFTKGDFYYNTGTSFQAMTRLAFGTGTGTSVLVRNGTDPVWGRINLASSDMVVGVLGISNGGTNSSASATQGGIAYGSGSALLFTSAGTAGQAFLSNGTSAPTFGTLTLAGGGTSNAGAGAANTYQFAQYNSVGSGISGFNLPTVSNSVLISATPINPSWSNGPLGVNYGGTGNSANLVARGVAYATPAGTALTTDVSFAFTPGTGLTITGNNTFVNVGSGGNYYINGAAVVSSFAGLNGAVGFTSQASNGGTSFIQTSGQSLILNYPGTGITGGGAQYQVAYYNATREISGSNAFTWNSAGSGNGLSITSAGFGISINNTSTTATPLFIEAKNSSGNIIDARVSNTTEFSVRFDGFTTAGGGMTVQLGKTTFAVPVAAYASINLPSSSATNPSSPVIGDLWFNGTNLYFRKDGATSQDLLIGSVSGSGTKDKIVKWNSSTSLTDSNITDAGTGMTITAGSAVGVGLGSTAYLTIKSLSGDEVAGVKNSAYFVRGIDSTNARMFSVDVAGNLRATTKSFDIPHPTKEGSRLVYGVLEGPEHGVYHRGTVEGKGPIQINLPDYWHKLVGDQYTIQLTPWGNYNVCIESKTENYFTIQLVGDFISRKFKNIKVDYIVHGSRIDAPLETEQ
jgi:hypothetical protein